MWYMVLQSDGSVIVTGSGTRGDVWNGLYLAKIRIGTAGVGDAEESSGAITVVPNPARDRLRVVLHSSGMGKGRGVRLYDLLGRDVLGRVVPVSVSGVAEIDVSGLPPGSYRVAVVGEAGRQAVAQSVMVVR